MSMECSHKNRNAVCVCVYGTCVGTCALVLFEDLVDVLGEAGIQIAADNLVAADDLVKYG